VYNIYRYLADRQKTNFIDIAVLVRHAVSFGFYTICTVTYTAVLCYSIWTHPDVDLLNPVAAVALPVEICSFIS